MNGWKTSSRELTSSTNGSKMDSLQYSGCLDSISLKACWLQCCSSIAEQRVSPLITWPSILRFWTKTIMKWSNHQVDPPLCSERWWLQTRVFMFLDYSWWADNGVERCVALWILKLENYFTRCQLFGSNQWRNPHCGLIRMSIMFVPCTLHLLVGAWYPLVAHQGIWLPQ